MKEAIKILFNITLAVVFLFLGATIGGLLEQELGGWWWRAIGVGVGMLALLGALTLLDELGIEWRAK